MLNDFIFSSIDQIKAYGHPLRLQLLQLLIEKTYTSVELADLVKQSRQKINYHLNQLLEAGLVKIEKEGSVNGLKVYYYRSVSRSFYLPAEDNDEGQILDFMRANEGFVPDLFLHSIQSDIRNYSKANRKESIMAVQYKALLTQEQHIEIERELNETMKKMRKYTAENQGDQTGLAKPIRLSVFNIPIIPEEAGKYQSKEKTD